MLERELLGEGSGEVGGDLSGSGDVGGDLSWGEFGQEMLLEVCGSGLCSCWLFFLLKVDQRQLASLCVGWMGRGSCC